MKVKQIASNMTVLYIGNTEVLFSYETPVAAFIPDEGHFRTDKKYSVTTSRHINKWLEGCNSQTKPQEWFDSLVEYRD